MTSGRYISTTTYPQHIPVLLNQLIEFLNPKKGDIVLDCTVGLGGHSSSLLKIIGKDGLLIGLDLDQTALNECEKNLRNNTHQDNFTLYHTNYRDAVTLLKQLGIKKIDHVVLDLGFSSFQMDNPARGFSFRLEGNLDMRLDPEAKINAEQCLNHASAEEIKEILMKYGEISPKDSTKIADAILLQKKNHQLKTTFDLKNAIHKKDLYPLVFQAIRIHINQELNSLHQFLEDIFNYLDPGAKIAIISFHSLEDRIVKRFFKFWSRECVCKKENLICNCRTTHPKRLELITKKAILPDKTEININPRARSSKLRVAKII